LSVEATARNQLSTHLSNERLCWRRR